MTETYKQRILKERAARLKEPIDDLGVKGEVLHGIHFMLGDENSAVDLKYTNGVVPLKAYTQLPGAPDFILGIANVRGKILAVVDIKKLLNLPGKGITNLNRLIIAKYQSIEIGILADEIMGTVKIATDELSDDKSNIPGMENGYFRGVTKERIIVLDLKAFLQIDALIINDEVK
jgi:purine-binding chemotaxis protein CheW